MRMVLGYGLGFVGLIMIIFAFLDWVGILKRGGAPSPPPAGRKKNFWEAFIELLKTAGWVATIGLVLVYFGLKTIGVDPF